MYPLPQNHYRLLNRRRTVLTWTFIIVLVALSGFCIIATNFSPYNLYTGLGQIAWIVFDKFLPPHPSALGSIVKPALDTVAMSLVAAMAGSVVAAVLGFLAARPTAPHPVFRYVVRGFASLLRNIPALMWAFILVDAYGLGTMVGTLALFFSTVGWLVRAYAEVIEEIDQAKLEAIRASGASYLQVLGQGILPLVLPGFIAWSLYQVEMNLRTSSIIGMVGGGGLGFYIDNGIALFQFKDTAMAIVLVLVLILGSEFLTSSIRRRIL